MYVISLSDAHNFNSSTTFKLVDKMRQNSKKWTQLYIALYVSREFLILLGIHYSVKHQRNALEVHYNYNNVFKMQRNTRILKYKSHLDTFPIYGHKVMCVTLLSAKYFSILLSLVHYVSYSNYFLL